MWLVAMLATCIAASGCGAASPTSCESGAPGTSDRPAWFSIQLTDVRTGATFSMNDFKGRVVLIETIAEWCPNCLFQQHQTRTLRTNLGNPADLVLISLDVDSHEDEPSLKDYTEQFGFDWYFAVAPLELERALGNLYSAEVFESAARTDVDARPGGQRLHAHVRREERGRSEAYRGPAPALKVDSVAVTSFVLGLLGSASPCVLPLYPGFLAYLCSQTNPGEGRQRYMLGFFVLAGVLTMMLVLGGIIAALAFPIGRSLAYVTPLADGVILLLGILLVADRNPFTRLPQVRVPAFRHPFVNAYSYGLLYGPLTLPCSSPLIVAIFALPLTVGEALNMFWTFVWFGIGFGVPLLVLSVLSGALQRQLTTLFARHSRQLNVLGGILLVGVAVYDLAQNWQMLRVFYFR